MKIIKYNENIEEDDLADFGYDIEEFFDVSERFRSCVVACNEWKNNINLNFQFEYLNKKELEIIIEIVNYIESIIKCKFEISAQNVDDSLNVMEAIIKISPRDFKKISSDIKLKLTQKSFNL